MGARVVSDNINRCTKKAASTMNKMRREISRMEFYEKPEDGEKEVRSILMARFPARKKAEDQYPHEMKTRQGEEL